MKIFHQSLLTAMLASAVLLSVGCSKKNPTGPNQDEQDISIQENLTPIESGMTPWPVFQNDLQHTGRSLNSGPETPTLKWEIVLAAQNNSSLADLSPIFGINDVIYLALGDGNLYSISTNGALGWRSAVGAVTGKSPAVDTDGTIYVSSTEGLSAFDQAGALKWNRSSMGSNWSGSGPVIGNGTLYVGSSSGILYANGSTNWESQVSGSISTMPALGEDGTIYVGSVASGQGILNAINPDGSLKWSKQLNLIMESTPTVGNDGTIYVGDDQGILTAFRPDGTRKWEFDARARSGGVANIDGSAALGSDGTIYVISAIFQNPSGIKSIFFAIDQTGNSKWSIDTGALAFSSPAIDINGTIYLSINADGQEGDAGATKCKVMAVTPDGALKWEYELGEFSVLSSPMIGLDMTIYVASATKLYAIGGSG